MDLGIVVVSYNTRSLMADCLESVYRSLEAWGRDAHVWVVDNASSDGSAEMVRERFPQATLIASPDNLGFARANNLAMAEMAGLDTPPRHILLLNPDTLVDPEAIPAMVSFLDENPRVGIVGAQLCYGDGSFQHGAFRFPTLWMVFFDFWTINHRLINSWLNGRYPRRWYEAGGPFPIDHPLGAALMIRWETLQEVGPLDTDYFMYCEEIDWCMRIKSAGWEIYSVPQAMVTHFAGQSTRQFREEMFVALWRSRYRLYEKHYSPLYQRAARLIVRLGLARKVRRIKRALRQGEIDQDVAQRQLDAYQHVMEM